MDDRKKIIIAVVIFVIAAGLLAWQLLGGGKKPGPVGGEPVTEENAQQEPGYEGGSRLAPGADGP